VRVPLRRVAHARAGDKGDTSHVSLIALDSRDYPLLRREVTAERVAAWFGDLVGGPVERYELPQLGALNFVMHRALGGGVTRSVWLDAHGKSRAARLLEMEVELDGA
jgi:hypothetical protein